MAKVEIKIVAKPTTDIYTRHHGKTIDEVLPLDWLAWLRENTLYTIQPRQLQMVLRIYDAYRFRLGGS